MPTFHTPPTLHERSYIAEQESYGLVTKERLGPARMSSDTVVPDMEEEPPSEPSEESSLSSEKSPLDPNENREDHPREQKPRRESAANQPKRLPSRLAHYIDLFLHSLQEPKYMTPLTGDDIAALYQEFYKRFAIKAEEYVAGKSTGAHSGPEVQMNSFEEIAEKKKERSQRPAKVNILVELAEAKACTLVYEKIFSVSHGEDMIKNERVGRKIALLKLLPITLLDLGLTGYSTEAGSGIDTIVHEAGAELQKLSSARWPKAKLDHLLAVHQIIVRILSEEDNKDASGGSSADAILPCLIYALIMSETPNIWLNLKFMYRFRNMNFLNGESMYCLTNFEAAATFLETSSAETLGIDLSAFPPDLDVSVLLAPDPLRSGTSSPGSTSIHQHAHKSSVTSAGSRGSRSNSVNKDAVRSQRRLSLLQLHYPSEIASSAADISIKSIGSTFGNSYRFLMGKFSEKKGEDDGAKYPHTLAEARRVVGLEPPASPGTSMHDSHDNSSTHSDNTSVHSRDNMTPHGSISSMSDLLRPPAPQFSPEKPASQLSQSVTQNQQAETSSVLGKWTGGMMRTIRASSLTGAPQMANPALETTDSKSVLPIDKFLTSDFDSLKISDLRELHADYKRLAAQLVKSLDTA